MVPSAPTTPIAPSLEKRLAAHKEEVARLREELGDPAEALDALVREIFDRDALLATYEEYLKEEGLWDDWPEPNDHVPGDG